MLRSADRQFVDNTVTECWIFEGAHPGAAMHSAAITTAVSKRSIWRKAAGQKKAVEAAQPKAERSVKTSVRQSYNR